jgi:hypothetical protein
MYSILVWQIGILDSMNGKIRSWGLYLPTVAVVVADADDGDGGMRLTSKPLMLKLSSKSSIRGGGRARRSWRRIRRDVAPPNLDERRPVVKVGSSCTDSASQKPYSSSPGVGSQRWGFQRPAHSVAGARKRSDWSSYDGNTTARKGKNPSSIRWILAWSVGCLYSPVQRTSCRDHDLSRFRTLRLEGQEIKKLKLQKETALPQSKEPDFGGPFT